MCAELAQHCAFRRNYWVQRDAIRFLAPTTVCGSLCQRLEIVRQRRTNVRLYFDCSSSDFNARFALFSVKRIEASNAVLHLRLCVPVQFLLMLPERLACSLN